MKGEVLSVALVIGLVFFLSGPLPAMVAPILPQSMVDPVPTIEPVVVSTPLEVPGKEYSDHLDKDANGKLDPGRVVHWAGDGVTVWDSIRYCVPTPGGVLPFETDAIANCRDKYTLDLIADRVPLLVSLARRQNQVDDWSRNVYRSRSSVYNGAAAKWADWQNNINGKLNAMEDLDGLEVWGPDETDDANLYSREGDPDVDSQGRTSVFWYHPETGLSVPYLRASTLMNAIIKDDGTKPVWGTGAGEVNPNLFDLDGLIAWDQAGDDDAFDEDWIVNCNHEHKLLQDIVVFSILAIDGVFDGGEIWVYKAGDVNATFLNQGGFVWNTAFQVGQHFGLFTEEIDALEALPEPGTLILLALGGAGVLVHRRWRR